MKKNPFEIFFLIIFVLFLLFAVKLFSQNKIVALTVVIKDRSPQELLQIKQDLQKVAEKYNLQVNEIPLGELVEKRMKSLK